MFLNVLLLALRAIRRNLMRSFLTVLGIVIGVAAVITMVTLVAGSQNWQSQVSGTTHAYFAAGNWNIALGRSFDEDEEGAGKAVCVIGKTVKKQLFGNASPIGNDVRVKNFSCQVIGLLNAKGQGAMGWPPTRSWNRSAV